MILWSARLLSTRSSDPPPPRACHIARRGRPACGSLGLVAPHAPRAGERHLYTQFEHRKKMKCTVLTAFRKITLLRVIFVKFFRPPSPLQATHNTNTWAMRHIIYSSFQRCAVCQILLIATVHPADTLCARSQIARRGLANVKRRSCRREKSSQQVTAGSYKHWSDEIQHCLRPLVTPTKDELRTFS